MLYFLTSFAISDMNENDIVGEQQQIKESWKVELPEQFDVCCNSNFIGEGNIHIPGRFYVQGNCYYDGKIIIDEDFIMEL